MKHIRHPEIAPTSFCLFVYNPITFHLPLLLPLSRFLPKNSLINFVIKFVAGSSILALRPATAAATSEETIYCIKTNFDKQKGLARKDAKGKI